MLFAHTVSRSLPPVPCPSSHCGVKVPLVPRLLCPSASYRGSNCVLLNNVFALTEQYHSITKKWSKMATSDTPKRSVLPLPPAVTGRSSLNLDAQWFPVSYLHYSFLIIVLNLRQSVSTVVGDFYPERNLFHILYSITSGPRLAMIALLWVHWRTLDATSLWPTTTAVVGVLRTLSCAVSSHSTNISYSSFQVRLQGWMYITSTDDHDVHDVCMGTYIFLTLLWEIGCIAQTPPGNRTLRKRRIWTALSFWGCTVPMVPLYIQHKYYRVPGAYSRYAYFEWGLIILDIAFDALAGSQLKGLTLEIAPEHQHISTEYAISRY